MIEAVFGVVAIEVAFYVAAVTLAFWLGIKMGFIKFQSNDDVMSDRWRVDLRENYGQEGGETKDHHKDDGRA